MKSLKQFMMMTAAGMAGAIFAIVLLGTSFTYTYDNATPPDTGESPRLGASRIRELKNALQERLNVCGYYPYTGTEISDACAGEIRRLLFHAPIESTPTVAENHFDIRLKDFDGKAELTLTDEDEQELQLTSAGTLNIVSADLLGTLANNTYFTAVNQAADGTVDLIKADANDVAVVPDNSQTATNAAPTSSTGIANKKYVIDYVAANTGSVNYTPASYAGGQSVTYPNGLIMKMGSASVTTGGLTVTFGAAFPTALVSATGGVDTSNTGKQGHAYDSSTTILKLTHNVGATATMHWIAIGY